MRAMTLPASLAESLHLLRTEVKSADLTNWHSLLAHSDAYIRTLRSYVKPGVPELPNAFAATLERCRELTSGLVACRSVMDLAEQALQNTRDRALAAIDNLER